MRPRSSTTARVQALAARNFSGELLGAAAGRCAAELARRHGAGHVPDAAIENVIAKFSRWLQISCEATRPAASEAEADGRS